MSPGGYADPNGMMAQNGYMGQGYGYGMPGYGPGMMVPPGYAMQGMMGMMGYGMQGMQGEVIQVVEVVRGEPEEIPTTITLDRVIIAAASTVTSAFLITATAAPGSIRALPASIAM